MNVESAGSAHLAHSTISMRFQKPWGDWIMTIHLPNDLISRVQSTVQSGRFDPMDDAMPEAARLLLRELDQGSQTSTRSDPINPGNNPFLGSLRESAEELDEIVADAYTKRSLETWESKR